MNTRKYPRSTMEAFPNTAEYGCAIERPRTGLEVQAGKACLKIRCTEPSPHRPPVQP